METVFLVIVFSYAAVIISDMISRRRCKKLEDRIKKLETELGIYTEEEVKKIKVGGTDSD